MVEILTEAVEAVSIKVPVVDCMVLEDGVVPDLAVRKTAVVEGVQTPVLV